MCGKCVGQKLLVLLPEAWHQVCSVWLGSGAALRALPAEPLGAVQGWAGRGVVNPFFPLTAPVVDFFSFFF